MAGYAILVVMVCPKCHYMLPDFMKPCPRCVSPPEEIRPIEPIPAPSAVASVPLSVPAPKARRSFHVGAFVAAFLVLVCAAGLGILQKQQNARQQLINAAIVGAYFEHAPPVEDANLISAQIYAWKEMYKAYRANVQYIGSDHAVVSFWSGSRLVYRREMRRFDRDQWVLAQPRHIFHGHHKWHSRHWDTPTDFPASSLR